MNTFSLVWHWTKFIFLIFFEFLEFFGESEHATLLLFGERWGFHPRVRLLPDFAACQIDPNKTDCFVGTSSALPLPHLTAQHCAWLFGIHGAWHLFSCCWGLCGTDWLVGISIVHYETKCGDRRRKKNIIREKGRLETGRWSLGY